MGCTSSKRKDVTTPIIKHQNKVVEEKKTKDDTVEKSFSPKTNASEPNIQIPTKILETHISFSDVYDFRETIAVFPYAEVRRCIHKRTGLVRAVKIVPIPKGDESYVTEKSLRREVRALSKLDHPNILKIYDILADEKRFYIVMECWEGGLLLDKFADCKNLNESKVCSIIEQLLSAIAYSHENKVLHRDLSPNSICMMKEGSNSFVKIIDLGVTAFVDVDLQYEGKFGNSYFLAPEVEDKFYNEKCDV